MAPKKGKRAKPKGKGKGNGKKESNSDHQEPGFADKPIASDQSTDGAIEDETTADFANISASDAPASNTMPGSFGKRRRNKKRSSSRVQPSIQEPLKSRDNILEPATKAPSNLTESTFDPEKNAFQDPDATRVPKEHILALFPTEASWRETHKAAVIHNTFARRRIVACMLFHSCIRNNEMPDVLHHGDLLQKDQWPYNAFPDQVRQNQLDWLVWMSDLDEAIPHNLIQMNWMLLLDGEYKATEPLWKRFWELIGMLDEAKKACEFTFKVMPPQLILNELAEIEVKMAVWNRRRHFLQRETIVGKAWEAKMHRLPPQWVDWNLVVRNMMQVAGIDSELSSGGVEDDYESGHVSELDDTESDEDYDL